MLCAWISDNPSPAGRMKLWSSTVRRSTARRSMGAGSGPDMAEVATLYPWSTKRPPQAHATGIRWQLRRLADTTLDRNVIRPGCRMKFSSLSSHTNVSSTRPGRQANAEANAEAMLNVPEMLQNFSTCPQAACPEEPSTAPYAEVHGQFRSPSRLHMRRSLKGLDIRGLPSECSPQVDVAAPFPVQRPSVGSRSPVPERTSLIPITGWYQHDHAPEMPRPQLWFTLVSGMAFMLKCKLWCKILGG